MISGVTSTFLWFALTFWVYLETRSVVATGVIGGAFAISSAVRDRLNQPDAGSFVLDGYPRTADQVDDFHGERVKENVYLPDWSQPARRDYTKQCAVVLAMLLPDVEFKAEYRDRFPGRDGGRTTPHRLQQPRRLLLLLHLAELFVIGFAEFLGEDLEEGLPSFLVSGFRSPAARGSRRSSRSPRAWSSTASATG